MDLKSYQQATLDVLRRFFEEARLRGPRAAYEAITREPEQARRLGRFGGNYAPLLGYEDLPYVCLRLPTGGGKTLLAAHSIGIAKDAWIEKDFPLALWLVPTNMIRRQTVDALNNPRHPYRQAMDTAFDGRVRVFDIADFTRLRATDLNANLCVVVGTLQTLRVESTDGRKVYAHHEELEPLFAGVPRRMAGLEPIGEDLAKRHGFNAQDIRYSFANLLHLHRPLMIVDEAHKAVTGLTRDMQARVNPCAIIEFTATPQRHSNILHAASAMELKQAEMIKLPVRLEEHDGWESAVTAAIATRAELAKEAEKDRAGYIRPIILFQAEDRNREVTAEVLRKHLIEVHDIAPDAIAVATGDQRGLDEIDLFDPACPIEHVITVEALKEGWDCSFAYVFCSVANIRSATDAEQLLGRVLRMPYARRRALPKLNKAYAHLVSKSFAEAANALRDNMVEKMGFGEDEADANIESDQGQLSGGLWTPRGRPTPSTRVAVPLSDADAASVRAVAPEKVKVETEAGATVIAVTGFLSGGEKERLTAALPTQVRAKVSEALARYEADHAHAASPAERGEPFVAPRLMAWVQGELALADSEVLAEYFDWSLADHSARLDEREFSISETADAFEIDLDGESLLIRHSDQTDQLLLDVAVEGWTEAGLVALLDRMVRGPTIGQGELIRWLSDVVRHLTHDRRIPLASLMRCRFVLARKLRDKLASIRAAERTRAYQATLFAVDAKPEVSFDNGFRFFDGMFDGTPTYRGKIRFNRHFLGWDKVPAFDGADDGEELKAAFQLDSLHEVEYWVRNVARHPNAFWLPLAGGRTYPDFVAKLKDGRILVVEYKGAHLMNADTSEKAAIGALWARCSEGKGVYLLAEKEKDGRNVKEQIRHAIGRRNR
jgi:type III restriction enzyme